MTTQEMFEHVEHSRVLLLDAAQQLDSESFSSRQKGMTSIRDLFAHLMDSEDYWVGSVILGEKRDKFVPDRYEDVATLRTSWERIRDRTRRVVSDVSEGRLSEKTPLHWEGNRALDVGMVFLHLFSHEIHHHGQVCLLMRQKGHEPPYVDLL